MPYSAAHKERVRRRIVAAARALFNRHGYAAVGIEAVMAAAGLTRGGFYRHFASKQALYLEAMTEILRDHPARDWPDIPFDLSPERAARAIVSAYLSERHCAERDRACPLVTQAETAARGDAQVKATYAAVLEAMTTGLASSLATDDSARAQGKALALAALCVGGLTLARAAPDPSRAASILAVVRRAADDWLPRQAEAKSPPERLVAMG